MDPKALLSILKEGTEKIFGSMVRMKVQAVPTEEAIELPQRHITAMVGFAGTHVGLASIHSSMDFGVKIASSMTGIAPQDLTGEDMRDALGEIANMIGGDFKSRFADTLVEKDSVFDQSVPSVISGEDYSTFTVTDAPRYCLKVTTEEGDTFYVELALKEA